MRKSDHRAEGERRVSHQERLHFDTICCLRRILAVRPASDRENTRRTSGRADTQHGPGALVDARGSDRVNARRLIANAAPPYLRPVPTEQHPSMLGRPL
jgi:hypothetical protein